MCLVLLIHNLVLYIYSDIRSFTLLQNIPYNIIVEILFIRFCPSKKSNEYTVERFETWRYIYMYIYNTFFVRQLHFSTTSVLILDNNVVQKEVVHFMYTYCAQSYAQHRIRNKRGESRSYFRIKSNVGTSCSRIY